jgi:hypothetical protein
VTKEDFLHQLHHNNSKVAEINNEIAKQRKRAQTPEVRLLIREFRLQLEYWAKDRKRITEALEKIELR